MKNTILAGLLMTTIVAAAISGGPAIAGGYGQKTPEAAAAKAVPAQDIVTTAVAVGQFNTLAVALKAAGLVETLQGKGPFTVFAPR